MTGRRHLDQRLRLHMLRAVDAIETHRSLLKASIALGVTQPALTKGLQELETILQTRLFDRSTRGVRPTEAGAVFVRSARSILAKLCRLDEDLGLLSGPGGGTVALGALPERLAALPANKPVPGIIGSGPFRLLESERVPGSQIVYERFAAYVPADGPPGLTSGAKRAELDRVEWLVMPEPATAAAALRTGAVDWMEAPPPGLLPTLRRDPRLVVATNDPTGVVPVLRFNSLLPPFNDVAIRRAVLSAVNQAEFMAEFSEDAANLRTGVGIFCPGTPFATGAGLDRTIGTASIPDARRAIEAAGYKGERVVMLEPADHPVNSVMAQVGADLFKKLGLHMDDQAMDAGTMFQRRGNREGLDRGGWSCFPSAVAGIDVLNPAVSFLARGNGRDTWYGLPSDPALEALRLSWFEAPGHAEQKAIAGQMQRQVLDQAPYLPLGQILQPTAYRREVSGILPGFAKFWNVRKA